jgi:hypothetical protein
MKTKYKYIHFEEIPLPRKTSTWSIRNNKSGSLLGVIKWYGPWRQYCFFPSSYGEVVFNKGCLEDINDFITQLMEIRRIEANLKKKMKNPK